MDGNDSPLKGAGRRSRRWLVSAVLVASGLVAGGILAGSHIAGAQGATSTATQAAASTQASNGARHGPDETLLTGTTASRVKAAALQAVPGGTVIRVETDSDGSPYEAHVTKSDGSVVTVKLDKNFKVTSTINGFGAGPRQSGSSGA
jgi:uncharacterized membrane protein YkoI